MVWQRPFTGHNRGRYSRTYPLLAKGKTKDVHATEVEITHRDDMTAGNGARHEIVPGKGARCNSINYSMMKLLNRHDIATTFLYTISETAYRAVASTMLPYEVAVMIEVDKKSSYKKRNPTVPLGRLPAPKVQFHLKTTKCEFRGMQLPWDDPFISRHDDTGVWVNDPHKPVVEDESIFIPAAVVYGQGEEAHDFDRLSALSLQAATVFDDGFVREGCRFVDFKLEFDDVYRVSDVVTPDEWRAFDSEGRPLSKQPFRDGASIEEMQRIYAEADRITSLFLQSSA